MPDPELFEYQNKPVWGRNEDPPFKPGMTAAHPLGVSWMGPWLDPHDGFNEHTRRNARALATTGCPVHLRSPGFMMHDGGGIEHPAEIKPLVEASIARYSVSVQQMLPRGANWFQLFTSPYLTAEETALVNRLRVVYAVWETDRLEAQTADRLNRIGQVWTACHANRAMLEKSGVAPEKIRVVPLPYFEDDPLLALRGRTRVPGPPRFLHIGKWEPRKAQDRMVAAFLQAFKPGEARLGIRSNPLRVPIEGFPQTPEDAIRAWLLHPQVKANGWTAETWPKAIQIFSTPLSRAELVRLHGWSDVYVTLSSGEGWDIPAFDAKLAGNRLVFTPSGGPQDFTDAHDVRVPFTGTIPCHPFYRWDPEAQYGTFRLDAAIDALRYAALRVKRDEPRELQSLDRFRAETVGRQMVTYLEEVLKGCPDPRVFVS